MRRLLAIVATVAALVSVSAASAAVPVLRVVSETDSTITFGWDPVAGADGYRFYADGKAVSRTFDPSRTTVRFGKQFATYKVVSLTVTEAGTVGVYPEPASPAGNVLQVDGTVTASALADMVAAAPSGPLTVRPADGQTSFTVTGSWTPRRPGVTVQHGVFGTIRMRAAGAGLTVEDSRLREFDVDGGNNWTLSRDVLDGECEVAQNFMYRSSGWRILNSTIRNYHVCGNESTHSEAFFIGADATDGLIQGNHFQDNGTTGHLFFTWFDQTGDGPRDPRNICVTGNTFAGSLNGYFSVQLRPEMPDSLNIRVDPNNTFTGSQYLIGNERGTRDSWVKPCSRP